VFVVYNNLVCQKSILNLDKTLRMNSENLFSSSNDRKENIQLNRNSTVEFSLTYDQYLMLQHYLPKKYSLLEYKATKKGPSGAALKFSQDDVNYWHNKEPNIFKVIWEFE
jgi:hypothetical protein